MSVHGSAQGGAHGGGHGAQTSGLSAHGGAQGGAQRGGRGAQGGGRRAQGGAQEGEWSAQGVQGAEGGASSLEQPMGRMALSGRGRGRRPELSAEEKLALKFKSYDLVPTR